MPVTLSLAATRSSRTAARPGQRFFFPTAKHSKAHLHSHGKAQSITCLADGGAGLGGYEGLDV